MLRILKRILTTGVATNDYPAAPAEPPEGSLGKPVIDYPRCKPDQHWSDICPSDAIQWKPEEDGGGVLSIDYGNCVYCGECAARCPGVIHMSKDFELAAPTRDVLITSAHYVRKSAKAFLFDRVLQETPSGSEAYERIGREVNDAIGRLYGRSLHIREVDAGSCNACEVEITALNNPVYDIERFGIHFVASPKHADMLLVTGPVTRNMEIALRQTYNATPEPRLVVAVGACAIGGAVFGKSYASLGGVDTCVPVDVYIPGCPPRPEALLHGILAAIRRMG